MESNRINNFETKLLDISDISGSCRVCMARYMKMNHIFDSDSNTVIDKIEFCTGILFTKGDGMPTHICDQCIKDLGVAYKFKSTCLNSENAFRKLLIEYKIKEEKIETDIDDYDDDLQHDNGDIKDIKNELKGLGTELRKNTTSSDIEVELKPTTDVKIRKVRGPRGPYKKTGGKPRRLKKMKFRKLFCEPCDIRFPTKLELEEHRKDMHEGPKYSICEVCGKTFTHPASLYSHVRSHLPPQYSCEQCDYKTWHKHDLVKHIRIHTGVKLYQCEICTASYYNSSNLACHKRRVHNGEKRFQCELCHMKFYDKTKLNRHIDSHNEVKRFECHVCHSCFTRRCYWKKHLIRQHNIEVPKQRPGRQKINLLIGNEKVDNIKTGIDSKEESLET